ncbi:hypothetical protein QJS10_CPB17g02595 [Acorus calamus]|uniref:Uncharacterized protein n=1 Tax=Acorus calamus TaxID=4465 RepID=A0AAV9CS52_ACOCL|nr:hypothetical protein QJS10_CPB17g02595 [Acorus calamus]
MNTSSSSKSLNELVLTCSLNKPCVGWVETYFKDCLCSLSDDISFSLGLASLFCWAVAEIPQIVTNFYSKSGHGVSLAFLLTWVLGDVFNLVGCLLEPATLPTQFYTALLYTIVTVILVLQIIYYDHILRWWRCRGIKPPPEVDGDDKNNALKQVLLDANMQQVTAPVRVSPPRMDKYYTSARSLASSGTPPLGSYLGMAKSGPSVLAPHDDDSSASDDDEKSLMNHFAKPPSKPRFISRSPQ